MTRLFLRKKRWYIENTQIRPQEAQLLIALMGSPRMTRDQLIEVLYPNPWEFESENALNHISALICYLNNDLRPHGWMVRSRHPLGSDGGYRLDRIETEEQAA